MSGGVDKGSQINKHPNLLFQSNATFYGDPTTSQKNKFVMYNISRTSSQQKLKRPRPKTNLMAIFSNIYSTHKIKQMTGFYHDHQPKSPDLLLYINTLTVLFYFKLSYQHTKTENQL